MLTFFGFRQLLFAITMFSAVEKTLSEGTDMAVTQSSFLMTIARVGSDLNFHSTSPRGLYLVQVTMNVGSR